MSEKGLDICDMCGATQVDFVYYRADNPNTPRLNEDVMGFHKNTQTLQSF
jgi:hypothetical protein